MLEYIITEEFMKKVMIAISERHKLLNKYMERKKI